MTTPVPVTEIVSLEDVKAHLGITGTYDDDELQATIDDITPIVEDITGPILARDIVDEMHDGGVSEIWLRNRPVCSVTSVYAWVGPTRFTFTHQPLTAGGAFAAYGWRGDLQRGQIIATVGGIPYPFMAGSRNVIVTYVAGRASVTRSIRRGSLEEIRHLWETQRGRSTGHPVPGYDETEMAYTPSGFLVPRRVMEALRTDPLRNLPGIA